MSDIGNKAVLAQNLAYYVEQSGKSRGEICSDLGIVYSTFSEWINGRKYPRIDKIEQMARYFGVRKSDLIERHLEQNDEDELETLMSQFDNIRPVKLKRFPLLGEIACGEPIFADEDRESFVMADMDIRADFCLRAKGDSMTGARIYDGDIVFIKEMPMVDNGDIAAVIIDDEATLKRVYYFPENGKLILNPENPAFEPLVYVGEELNEIRILGKAVYFMSAL